MPWLLVLLLLLLLPVVLPVACSDMNTRVPACLPPHLNVPAPAWRCLPRAACVPAELATKAEEVGSLHEAQRSAQSQINMYIADLQVQ